MTSRGGLWEARLRDGKTPVWLLEWRLRLQLRRRVLIAVDRSDSCDSEVELVRECLRIVGGILNSGDFCAVWIMGSSEPVWEAEIGQDRLAQAFDACRQGTRGGTWLKTSFDAMKLAARGCPQDERCVLMIVSDGEVFDAEAVKESELSGVGFVRLGGWESDGESYLQQSTRPLTPTDRSLRDFLTNGRPMVQYQAGWQGTRAIRFLASGDLLDGASATIDETEEWLRVAFIGGTMPLIRITYKLGSTVWTDMDLPSGLLPGEGFDHLRRVLSRLSGGGVEWDEDRLRQLAAGLPVEFPCPHVHCGFTGSSIARSLFCHCRALLVSRDGVRREDLPVNYKRSVRFEINQDGTLGPAQPHDAVRDIRSFSIEKLDGRQWLVLNLFKM